MKALEIDGPLAEPCTPLGWVRTYYDWNSLGAETEFQRAIELSTNYNYAPLTTCGALFCRRRDRVEEAILQGERA